MATVIKAGNATTGVQVTADTTGILEIKTGTGSGTTAITVGTDQAVTFAAGTTVSSLTTSGAVSAGSLTVNSNNISAVNSLGFRNRIINGDMRIDQRNAGASVTPTNDGAYTLDRWQVSLSAASKFSVQQSSTAPAGFINSALITSLSAYSVPSGGYFMFNQPIEGLNAADLAWGTASASTVTLSFWVRSSLTGTFGGAIQNNAQNRSYPFSYTISSANTFEYKTVTIPGDTTGTWLTTNGVGMFVRFGLGVGSTFSTTAGAWAAGQYFAPTGATSVVGTNGATFYITGVQLEAGSVATPFERRDYGRELMMCQRYYQQFDSADNASAGAGFVGVCGTTSVAVVTGTYLVEMRTAPTVTYNNININYGGATSTITALTSYASKRTLGADVTVTGTPLTIGRAAVMQFAGGASISNRIAFSAEL